MESASVVLPRTKVSMTDREIVLMWFLDKDNHKKIPTVTYSREVYGYLVAHCDNIQVHGETFYCVQGEWQKLLYH